jgi:Mrp family chromosome partitioning ATPase
MAPGLRDVLTGRFPLPRALRESGLSNLLALTSGATAPPNTPWPSAESLRTVLRQLRKHFDWVLVDVPSWDAGPEMAGLASATDAVYLVLRPADLGTPRVAELVQLIPHLGTHVGGYIVSHR